MDGKKVDTEALKITTFLNHHNENFIKPTRHTWSINIILFIEIHLSIAANDKSLN